MKLNFHTTRYFLILSSFVLSVKMSKAQTTYKDVAPIFIANCTSCHHSGGLQFPLTKYSEILPMSTLIKMNVLSNKMPPWSPDPTFKHYVNERVVSQADKNLLIDWIDNGSPAGDTTLAPPTPVYGQHQLNGTPDMVLSLPTYTSSATTSDKYVCLNVSVNITQDRFIRAFEFVPGNAAIIHHAVMTIDTTGNAVDDLTGNCFNFQGQINIGDYAPGMIPTVLPNVAGAKFGIRLKAGSKMSFQLHVPKGTSGMIDNSKLNLFLYPVGETGVREMFFETALQNWAFTVPANTKITATAKYPTSPAGVPINLSLYSCFPHSHQTCTSILNVAYKNADTIPLVRIPKWDFHWQGQYTFPNMVKMPQGYRLFSSHVFDNTVDNPNTPDPNVAVNPGYFTDDEMLFDSFLYTYYQNGDENIDVAGILANDPLLNPTSVEPLPMIARTLNVYPNPFTQWVNFDYELPQAQFVQVTIVNSLGQIVARLGGQVQATGTNRLVWKMNDTNSLPHGTYFYKVQAGKYSANGSIVK